MNGLRPQRIGIRKEYKDLHHGVLAEKSMDKTPDQNKVLGASGVRRAECNKVEIF
jgi:hypothetical protein